jgi:GGDEF domain-containing protein
VERRQPISGLVVSIGLTEEKDANADNNTSVVEPVPASVRTLIESMIGPGDFAAQSGKEEYLLIYPGVRGAAAQRKLSEVAQQLWDFQLLTMGQFSVQFSWGGVEVRSESIEEAIASATERMNETRRGRKVVAMDSEVRSALPKAG